MRTILLVTMLVGLAGAVHATELPAVVLGDYDAEPRGADGRVDIPLLIQRLQDMGANTYMWLIWHAPTDWEDLQRFLPEAAKAKIQVWAYLCPFSEQGPEGTWPFSEPYRLDFVKWAQEIAKLSLKYPNLVGWVIDDFGANVDEKHFSADLLGRMKATAKAINPNLRFYPLLYYPEIKPDFIAELAPYVDGAVAAYHQRPQDIQKAVGVLYDDVDLPGGCWTVFPADTPSKPGDFASVTQSAKVLDPRSPTISFRYEDTFDGPTKGYHVMQLLVDGQVAWSEDVARHDNGSALVNLHEFVANKPTVQITLGVFDLKGVSQFPVQVAFRNLRVTGLEMHDTDLGDAPGWLIEQRGAFRLECRPERKGNRAYSLPLIVMPAGARGEYKHRYNEEATPENMAARAREAFLLMGTGRIQGVVMYCLDKTPDNPDLPPIRALFDEFKKACAPRRTP